MIRLSELIEGSFGKSGKVTHVMDVPMFSVFVPTVKSVPQKLLVMHYGEQIKRECEKARNEIHRIGFPSMHANIIMRDLSKEPNPNTGEMGVAGLAHSYRKYMEIDSRSFNADTIIHEWAHLWMMNHSKDFKKAIKLFYNKLIKGVKVDKQSSDIKSFKKDFKDNGSFIGKEFGEHRTVMAKLNNWVNSYGMSNEDELWATAIEYFFKLPINYRKALIKIMMYD